jgi:exoribonuclease-2
MEPGNVVEYIDNQKIICAVVLEVKKLRLRLLTENNREIKMSVGRLAHRSKTRLDPSANRDKQVAQLKAIASRRRDLSAQIDLKTLWEVLNSEQEWIDLSTMTALCFPDNSDGDHQAAVMRAVFGSRLYFKFSPERYFPYSEKKVAQIMEQRKAAERLERMVEQGGQWMRKILKGSKAAKPQESPAIIKALASYYLLEKESPHKETAKRILKKAGAGAPTSIFTFLVKIGIWHPHENIDLLRYQISVQLPEAVVAQARELCKPPVRIEEGRRDLRDLPSETIDGPGTLDFDDAVSIIEDNGVYHLGIHIADVAHYVSRDSAIDTEAMTRASSIYMPDQKIPMLPASLSEDRCSLIAGQDRLALSTLVSITAEAEILDFEIVPSVIRVSRQLTFQDVDGLADQDESIRSLHTIARSYRQRRLDNGAMIIDLPEIAIWLTPEGEPAMARIDRENPGRMLVSELMIMSNELSARLLADNQVPAIYRGQADPRERLFDQGKGSLFQNWMQRRLINRFVLSSTPEPHSGLGLPAYITASSPIRKYSDLITQRQLRAQHGLEPTYDGEAIDRFIATLRETMGQVGRIQYQRHRYWLLKLLEDRVGQKEEGLVLHKRRDGYAILLPAYMIECQLSGTEKIKLKPEDLVQVTLQHVNARNDVISVYLG